MFRCDGGGGGVPKCLGKAGDVRRLVVDMSLYVLARSLGCRLEYPDWCPAVYFLRSMGQVSIVFFFPG